MHPINGHTEIIALIGYPTHSFKSPMIYNPWFAHAGTNAVVVPFGVPGEGYPALLKSLFSLSNIRGALITMPHKVVTVGLLDEVTPTARVAGACNAVKRTQEGRLLGDMFDGAGFVQGVQRKGLVLKGAKVLVVGCGGVGSAIAASLAGAGIAEITLFDLFQDAAMALGQRIARQYPAMVVGTGSRDPAGFDLVVNATPLGMNEGDPLPVDVSRLSAHTFVGEVVMRTEMTAFLQAAKDRGCAVQVGTDMLFEQIPSYLEFFGLPGATPEQLRELAQLHV